MNNQTLLITGGAGFIGSNFVPYFVNKYKNYNVINLDSLTYAANLENLKEIQDAPNYTFIKGDICDRAFIEKIFKDYDIKGVIHFAAESHVDNSINGPEAFIKTNVMGTFTLLDVARKHWLASPFNYKEEYSKCRFHHISTDEVYGTLKDTDAAFEESTPYAPNSPYSASKASSDFIVRSYFHTYGMNVTTSNCSNNYGPKQHPEKLIPKIITNCLRGKQIPVYGDGMNIRDWLYVLDHCKGIDLVYHKGTAGQTYNIGGENERNNLYIVKKICSILDELKPKANGSKYEDFISFVKDRPGHDRRYAINAAKIKKDLGWQADENFESGILKTVNWYLENYS